MVALSLIGAAYASPAARNRRDFDQFWDFVEAQYAYLPDIHTDWDAVKAALEPRAEAATTREELVTVLEDGLDQLYDPHCMLNTNNDTSWRPVPHELYAEWRDGEAVVTAVQSGVQGVVAGDRVLKVDGQELAQVVDQRRPRFLRSPDPRADEWALLSAVAGRHSAHSVQVRHADGVVADVDLSGDGSDIAALSWDRVEPNLGRISIHSYTDPALVDRFDQALAELHGVDGLIIDLRSNSGGDTTVALPMVGRLIDARAQYASMARREGAGLGARWPEYVDPRGETVRIPVVVVVDRFTVSMGEGMAMAIQQLGRGKIVGTKMGELGAGVGRVTLKKSKIPLQISAEPVYTASGTPRDDIVPDVPVDPTAPSDGDLVGDPYLAAAVATLTGR